MLILRRVYAEYMLLWMDDPDEFANVFFNRRPRLNPE